jgi:hypothetical protein
MPVTFQITIVEERPEQMAIKVHCPPQSATAREKATFDQLNQTIARMALEVNARSAEPEQHRN